MEMESNINPEFWEGGSGPGYGIVQWTPQSVLIADANALNLSPYSNGDVQLKVIIQETINNPTLPDVQWIPTSGSVSRYYDYGATSDMVGVTGQQFLSNTMGWSPDKLAMCFMACYLRPLPGPSIHYQQRQQKALDWYTYMGGQPGTFTPRLDDTGIVGDFHYYSQNPYYQSGYGMPNCTAYSFGRFWEIGDPQDTGANYPSLPMGNGAQWFAQAVSDGIYQTGQTPQLGAVICFSDNNGGSGHVAIVEEIASDGTLTCSNSAWQGTFFFLSYITPVNNTYNWSHYTCQGFIYNPYAFQPIPPQPPGLEKQKKFPWVLYARKFRNRRNK